MPGLFDDPTPEELMEQKRRLDDLTEIRARENADIARERARQAEEPQPKRHRPEVDQFALAAKHMARNKRMPQPEPPNRGPNRGPAHTRRFILGPSTRGEAYP